MSYHREKFGTWVDKPELYDVRGKYAMHHYFGEDFNQNKKVLEFGCGVGQNLRFIKHKFGYDINKMLYPLLKSQGITTYDSLDEIPNDYFDVILMCMVLEHLPNPFETLKILKTKLKKNGVIKIVLPQLDYSLEGRGGLNHSTDGHTFGWTFYEINYLLNLADFEVLKNKTIWRRGHDRLYKLEKYGLYFPLVKFFGKILNNFDIYIEAKRRC